jgi:hypothetical protein
VSRVVLITGPFRSGTSLIASIVHRLGFHVAPSIPAPAPPSWRSDWEDVSLTQMLMRGFRPSTAWFRGYLERRSAVSRATGFEGRIAVKSPYLAMFWQEITDAAPEAFLIRMTRGDEGRQRSLRAHPALAARIDDEKIIAYCCENLIAHVTFNYVDLLTYADMRIPRLAHVLGVTDRSAIDAAGKLVGYPTEYPCPQLSPL